MGAELTYTYDQAMNALGVSKSMIQLFAKQLKWTARYEGKGGRAKRLFLKSDVDNLVSMRSGVDADKAGRVWVGKIITRDGWSAKTTELVEWADSLTEWPSDDEINARVDGAYQFKDIESVLDTRVFRFQDPDKALRQPAMRVEDRRGRLMV